MSGTVASRGRGSLALASCTRPRTSGPPPILPLPPETPHLANAEVGRNGGRFHARPEPAAEHRSNALVATEQAAREVPNLVSLSLYEPRQLDPAGIRRAERKVVGRRARTAEPGLTWRGRRSLTDTSSLRPRLISFEMSTRFAPASMSDMVRLDGPELRNSRARSYTVVSDPAARTRDVARVARRILPRHVLEPPRLRRGAFASAYGIVDAARSLVNSGPWRLKELRRARRRCASRTRGGVDRADRAVAADAVTSTDRVSSPCGPEHRGADVPAGPTVDGIDNVKPEDYAT